MSSLAATPLTVTFMGIGCGFVKSLFGSTSVISSSTPTLNVLSGVMPVAVRRRKSYRPGAVSASILNVALS